MELKLWQGESRKGCFLICLLQGGIQKPVTGSEENRGQEEEAANLKKITSVFMEPSCV